MALKLDVFNMIATEHITKVLEESLYMQDRIFLNLPIIAILCNDEGRIIRLNSLAFEHFKLDPLKKILGSKIWEYYRGDSSKYFEDFFSRKVSNVEFIGKESYLDMKNTDEYIFWQTHCVKRGTKRKGVWIILGTNTKELRRTYEAEIFQAARRNSIMNLSAGIAHEFNNPLTILLALVRRIKIATPDNTEVHNLLDKAKYHLDRISKFVNKFKKFGYDSEDSWDSIDINSVIKDTFALAQAELKEHNITLEINLHKDLPLCFGNFHGLVEMTLALLNNSKEAVLESQNKNKKIEVSTILDKANVIRIVFRDNGVGIAKEHMERVFDPFFTTKNIGMGAGLGLALAYNVVRSHNGQILMQSEKNQFTQVDVLIPCERNLQMTYLMGNK